MPPAHPGAPGLEAVLQRRRRNAVLAGALGWFLGFAGVAALFEGLAPAGGPEAEGAAVTLAFLGAVAAALPCAGAALRRTATASVAVPGAGAELAFRAALQPLGFAPHRHEAGLVVLATGARPPQTVTIERRGAEAQVTAPGHVLARLRTALGEAGLASLPASRAPEAAAALRQRRLRGALLVVGAFLVAGRLASSLAQGLGAGPEDGSAAGWLLALTAAVVAGAHVRDGRLTVRMPLPGDAGAAFRAALEPRGWSPLGREANVMVYAKAPPLAPEHVTVVVHGPDATVAGPAATVRRLHEALARAPAAR